MPDRTAMTAALTRARAGVAPMSPRLLEGGAIVLSLLWLVALIGSWLLRPDEEPMGLMAMGFLALAALVPPALIWGAVVTLRGVQDLRREAAQLQSRIDALSSDIARGAALTASRPNGQGGGAAAAAPVAAMGATFSSRRDAGLSVPSADRRQAMAPPRPDPDSEQPALALGTPAESARTRLSVQEFIRAMQFPENPDDKEGFRALRLALEDREVAKLIRAAQDVLTLLSQEGIYMDDLPPELTHPDHWRRFAAGERGGAVAAVGGVRERAALTLTATRMREDMIFRDAAHHFLRTYDRVFQQLEKSATDSELVELSDTRTARAFMVVGRVAGVFD